MIEYFPAVIAIRYYDIRLQIELPWTSKVIYFFFYNIIDLHVIINSLHFVTKDYSDGLFNDILYFYFLNN